MATVTGKVKPFNHEDTQRKVRSPLQLVRKYIRRYIILEGLALTLLFASLFFWIGLGIDYGLYRLDFDWRNMVFVGTETEVPPLHMHGVDWLLELNDLDTTGVSSLGIRGILFAAILIGLLVLFVGKVVTRWFREFNDQAVALVLERRFPKELGDRLITAVELANPKLSKKYGYSQAMVEKTIVDCVDRLKKLPVASVFNWGRLTKLWTLVLLSTVGILVVTSVAFCGGSYLTDEPTEPFEYACNFYDASATWTERNVLMMNTYWPRRAFLEIGRFQKSKEDPNEMRVAKDDAARPELLVRAYEWVIADRDRVNSPHGWRALTWKDLSERKLIDGALLARVQIPDAYENWVLDPEELEPNLVAALFDTATHERTSADLREHFQNDVIQQKIADRTAQPEIDDWLDWHNWKMDKLIAQMNDARVQPKLQSLNDGADYAALTEIVTKLKELADSPSMSRTLRQLDIPKSVDVTFRGEMTSFSDTITKKAGNIYPVSLSVLKDSTKFRMRVRGDNYYTQPKTITLVGAPTPSKINLDKEEPAYIYHRLLGLNQMPLRGQKHLTMKMPVSTTGESYTIEVPLGTNLVIHVETDRLLRKERSVFIRDQVPLFEGFDHYRGKTPEVMSGRTGFSLAMTNVTRKHDFWVEYFDEDNIKGKRRFKVLAHIDQEPQLGNLHVSGVNLRKPKFKLPERKEKDNDTTPVRDLTELQNSVLITPDAILPFECLVRDDYGLVKAGYEFKYRVEDYDLFSQTQTTPKKAPPKTQPKDDPLAKKGGLGTVLGMSFLALAGQRLDPQSEQKFTEGYVASEGFAQLVASKSRTMIAAPNADNMAQFKKMLIERRLATPWEFDFKDDRNQRLKGNEIGLDLRQYVPGLKAVNVEVAGQNYYLLKVAVQATDNNVETGAVYKTNIDGQDVELRGNTKKNKNGYINFLVVSENQLLSQIALEEEVIYERLEAAKEKVDASLVSLSEQQARIGDPNIDMENVLIRMNEIRTALSDTGTKLKDAKAAYDNIHKEMDINRVRKDRMQKIEKTIIEPLQNIIQEDPVFAKYPLTGSLPHSDDALHDAYRQVEGDVSANRRPDVTLHRKNMREAETKMQQLSRDINKLLDAMTEGMVEAKLIAILVSIEQNQKRIHDEIVTIRAKAIEDELRKLLGKEDSKDKTPEDKKDDKNKKDEKKDPKKTSALQSPFADVLTRHEREVIMREPHWTPEQIRSWLMERRRKTE